MSLDHAILGFLNYSPQTGYDLKKTFDNTVSHFWAADRSQIYRTLARLSEQGFITMEKIPQDDRPDRKLYHITEAGQAELRQWLLTPPPVSEPHSASMIQIFFGAQLTDTEVLSKFEGYAAFMRAALAQYEQIENQIGPSAEVPSQREAFFWKLTLEAGIFSLRANLAWTESVIDRIKNGQLPTS